MFLPSSCLQRFGRKLNARSRFPTFQPLSGSYAHAYSSVRPGGSILSRNSKPRLPVKRPGGLINQDGRAIVLTDEQQFLLDRAVNEEKSLFFTGSAGTGKSILLREMVRRLQLKGRKVAVTASTGKAAVNIGGITIHSFAGLGITRLSESNILKRACGIRSVLRRWRETQILVIDEVSMVDAWTFDMLNRIGQEIRKNRKPFGGIQVIISGDFFQLPPVPEKGDGMDYSIDPLFAFEAGCWTEAWPETFKLTKVFRQEEPRLINLLNEMRLGNVSQGSATLLSHLSRELDFDDGILPTEIYPHRLTVDSANSKHMNRLTSELHHFEAEDTRREGANGIIITKDEADKILGHHAPKTLTLRAGAQVMCTKNIADSDIVNGSIGQVIDFLTLSEAERKGYPCLGVMPGMSKGIEKGTKDNTVMNLLRKWPLVHFADSGNYLVTAVDFRYENDLGLMKARRRQVPLTLAWAMTIHKAQGQTIPRLKVDLHRTFADGQVYVAISRCKTLEGLQVLNFSPRSVFANPKVIEWDKNLSLALKEQTAGSRDLYNAHSQDLALHKFA